MQSIISLLYIGLGGFIGAISRWGVSQIIRKSTDDGAFPLPTLIVNLLGCLGIGIAYSIWENNNSAKLIIIIGLDINIALIISLASLLKLQPISFKSNRDWPRKHFFFNL